MNLLRCCRSFQQRFVLLVANPIRIGCGLAAVGIGLIAGEHLAARGTTEVNATYGRGVHAYFAGDSQLAEELFTQSIQAGSTDPRVFYFRAMVRLSTGQQAQAEEDMQRGATYEANRPSSRLSVSQALQRVQGPGRIQLERFRRRAQLEQARQRRQKSQRRYERLQRREELVLRSEAFQPQQPEEVVQPTETPFETSTVPAVRDDNPFAEPAESEIEPGDSDDDPFANPAESESDPDANDDDPFAEPAESETEPGDSDDDPFAEPAEPESEMDDSGDDPFADTTQMSDESASPSGGSVDSGKMESGKLLGVLQRVFRRAMPWSGLPRRRVIVHPGNFGDVAGDPVSDMKLGPGEQIDDSENIDGDASEDDDPFGGMDDEEDPFEASQGEGSDANDGDQPATDLEEDPFEDF